jgi:hypothetical protein
MLATAAFGGESVAPFAKQSLGIDLATIPFGKTVQTNGEYGLVTPPLSGTMPPIADAGFSWMTNAVSAKYTHDFPNRVLRYGFREGRLITIRISINALFEPGTRESGTSEQSLFEHRHKELIQIQDELISANPSHKINFQDASYHLEYGAMCAPTADSLFLTETQITPIEGKKAP